MLILTCWKSLVSLKFVCVLKRREWKLELKAKYWNMRFKVLYYMLLHFLVMSSRVGNIIYVLDCSPISTWDIVVFRGSTSFSSMKRVRGSTLGKNSDEIRKILGHSIAVDNNHKTMAVEVEYWTSWLVLSRSIFEIMTSSRHWVGRDLVLESNSGSWCNLESCILLECF